MYCTNCGKEVSQNAKFCSHCGEKVKPSSSKAKAATEVKQETRPLTDDEKAKLAKLYKTAGDSSLAIGILVLIAAVVFIALNPSNSSYVYSLIVTIPLVIPLIIYGQKIKKADVEKASNYIKILKNMWIYSIICPFIAMLVGGFASGLVWFVAYYYNRAYRATQALVADNLSGKSEANIDKFVAKDTGLLRKYVKARTTIFIIAMGIVLIIILTLAFSK